MSQTEINNINPEGTQRQCDNCQGDVGIKDKMCTRCGFALSPVRSTKTKWSGISFPVFVFWVSVFCVLMILWLPR
jgi:predicted amidophosphoribosyltransferase